MQPTVDQVKQVLRRGLDDPRFHLEPIGSGVGGSVISGTFHGMDDRPRRELIWNLLADGFGHDVRDQVASIFAFSPTEWEYSDVADEVLVS